MVKELLKASIIGASIIVSTIIYSEMNKYEFSSTTFHNYSVLNKRTGEVQSFRFNVADRIRGTYYENIFDRYTSYFGSDEVVLSRNLPTVIVNLNEDSDE